MKAKRSLALLFCAALITSVLAAGCSGKTEPPADASQPVQDVSDDASTGTARELGSLHSFEAGTLDAEIFTQDDIAGKDMTVVNFWSLTCRPCIAEMPDLAAFSGALPDNVQVVTVCLDGSGNEEVARAVLDNAGYTGVTLISGNGDLAALCMNLIYTPTTVLVDSEGNLMGNPITGMQADLSETLLTAVNAALAAGGKAEISLAQ